jgi:hypothetical protein
MKCTDSIYAFQATSSANFCYCIKANQTLSLHCVWWFFFLLILFFRKCWDQWKTAIISFLPIKEVSF